MTVLGTGAIAQTIGHALVEEGYQVQCWGPAKKPIAGLKAYFGPQVLFSCLSGTDVLINLLPRMPETQRLISTEHFKALNKNAIVISCGRGDVIDEQALCQLLQTPQLRGALLDVFDEDPLPQTSPFWGLSNVIVAPHIAGPASLEDSVSLIYESILALEQDKNMHLVPHQLCQVTG